MKTARAIVASLVLALAAACGAVEPTAPETGEGTVTAPSGPVHDGGGTMGSGT